MLDPLPGLKHHPRGSTMVLTIAISIVITALVSTMCWVAGESSQRTASLSKIDQAFFAAEAGAQRVQWYCKNGQMAAISSPLSGTLNGDSYSVSWSTVSGSTIRITSVGTSGAVAYSLSQQVTPPIVEQPAITSMSAFDNKNIDITGDVVVAGDYSNSGSGSLNGNLTYYGTATNTNSVTGSITHASDTPTTIDFAKLGSTLAAAAAATGKVYSGDQTNKVFDFTALSGANKVIYVNGNITNPTIIGSGTLYASGTISGTGDFGSSGNPVNLVAQGNISTDNNVLMYGSLYTAANWNRGKFNLKGLVYTGGVIKTNSASSTLTITQDATPWFDPRAVASAASSTTTVTSFAGPMP